MVAELIKDLAKTNNNILYRDRLLEKGLGDKRKANIITRRATERARR